MNPSFRKACTQCGVHITFHRPKTARKLATTDTPKATPRAASGGILQDAVAFIERSVAAAKRVAAVRKELGVATHESMHDKKYAAKMAIAAQ